MLPATLAAPVLCHGRRPVISPWFSGVVGMDLNETLLAACLERIHTAGTGFIYTAFTLVFGTSLSPYSIPWVVKVAFWPYVLALRAHVIVSSHLSMACFPAAFTFDIGVRATT